MRDPPPHGQHPAGKKINFDPLFNENASKNTTIFLKVQLLSDVTTQSQPGRHLTFYDITIRDFT